MTGVQTCALPISSGSGKSTIASLLCRFYDPQNGAIRIDGIDIRDLPIRTLRQNVAYVSQDVILFSGSIRENLMLGDPDADEPRMIDALKNAGALEFIEKLEHGLETQIGEHGLMLSGGGFALLYARIQRAVGYAGIFALGYGAMALGFLMLLLASTTAAIFAAVAAIGAGYALVSPGFVALALNLAPAQKRGLAGGILTASIFIANSARRWSVRP